MSDRALSLVAGTILVVGAGSLVWFQTRGAPVVATPVASGPYAMAEVETHDSAESCWTVIDDVVYDLTGWVSQHPGGGQAILSLCGTDGTAAFRGQHGTNERQANILQSFEIGRLSE